MDQFVKVDLSIYDNSWYHPGLCLGQTAMVSG